MAHSENNARKEWGLPDWRDPPSYGDTKKWSVNRSVNRWRWEFSRRREDYRAEFDTNAQTIYDQRVAALQAGLVLTSRGQTPTGVTEIDEPGFTAAPGTKYGLLGGMPNPRISEQPWHVIKFTKSIHSALEIIQGATYDPDVSGAAEESVSVPDGWMAARLDLSKPWDQQGEVIRLHFIAAQKRRFGTPQGRRERSDKWLRYLRVLDGRECGATYEEIAEMVGLDNASRVVTDFNAAKTLMYNWPV